MKLSPAQNTCKHYQQPLPTPSPRCAFWGLSGDKWALCFSEQGLAEVRGYGFCDQISPYYLSTWLDPCSLVILVWGPKSKEVTTVWLHVEVFYLKLNVLCMTINPTCMAFTICKIDANYLGHMMPNIQMNRLPLNESVWYNISRQNSERYWTIHRHFSTCGWDGSLRVLQAHQVSTECHAILTALL